MKSILFTLIFYFICNIGWAQEEGEPLEERPVFEERSNVLYGKVVERSTARGLEAISVQLYVGRSKDSLVAAMFTRPNGDFKFTNLPFTDSFTLVLSAVGFAGQEQTISFSGGAGDGSVRRDVGNLVLAPDVQILTGVVVNTRRPTLQMGVDRRVFNVAGSLTATGGTGVDVMKNIPSVTVDVDGNVTLRNSSPQVFVDGRPTILTLEQIPADNIERVELITNPSAKFDAASTGGIINIVLKRNRRVGLNGVASAGVGYPGIVNGNVSLNVRQGRFNFFATGSLNRSGGENKGETNRENREEGRTTGFFDQRSLNERSRSFGAMRFGVDFFLDNRNTLSLTQGLVKGKFRNNETQDQGFFTAGKALERRGARTSEGRSGFNRYNTALNVSHKFADPGKELTASATYNWGSGDNRSDILNTFFNPNGSPAGSGTRVRNSGSNNNNQLTVQADFVNPMGEDAKFEVGLRTYINEYENRFATYSFSNGNESLLPLGNNISYKEVVNAAYGTLSGKLKSIAYQAGLRAEHSQFDGQLLDSGKEFGYTYPGSLRNLYDALFPSLFLTKQLGEEEEVQLNYSRRIRRPNFYQLNPFLDINDPLNISQGNPALRPEYTNSFEANYSKELESGSVLGSVYFRNTQGNITRYSDTITAAQFALLDNASVDSNAILNSFINGSYSNRLGAEITLQRRFGERWDITPTANAEFQNVQARVGGQDLGNRGINWEAKLITNYRIAESTSGLLRNFSVQVVGDYESPRIVPQGKTFAEYGVDVALRKEFGKDNAASFTLSANDIFWTDRDGSIYDTENFYQESYRRNVRSFRVNFSYRFGNTDLKLFKGRSGGNDEED